MNKLYILVRKDLSMSHIAVQAGHAVGEFCKELPLSALNDWNNTLVYLGVSDEQELNSWWELLNDVEPRSVQWRESYWDNSLTSFAVIGSDTVQKLVRGLKLI